MDKFPSLGWRYAIQNVIGSGGTATVYKALDLLQGRELAVKYAGIQAQTGLKQEFIRLFRLRHEGIVKAYEYHRAGEGEFFTMELCRGGTVGEAYRRLDAGEKNQAFLDIWSAMARTLSYLHQRGLVHGDLKPDNILWDSGSVKLLDLGLSKRGRRQEGTGFLGTPAYAAPELIRGDEGATVGSDIYSLGLLLFELLTGRLPDYRDRMSADGNWNTSAREMLPPDLAEILTSMLRYDALDRPASASRLLQSLAETGKAAAPERIADLHFTGRGKALGDLQRALPGEVSGMVMITGQSGCGKTRLLQETNFLAQIKGLESHFTPAMPEDLAILAEMPKGATLFVDDIAVENRESLAKGAKGKTQRMFAAVREQAAATAASNECYRIEPLVVADHQQMIKDIFPGMISYSSTLLARHLLLMTGGNLSFARQLLNHWLELSFITRRHNAWLVVWTRLYGENTIPTEMERGFTSDWNQLEEGTRQAMLRLALQPGAGNSGAANGQGKGSYWVGENGRLRCGMMTEYIVNRCAKENQAEIRVLLSGAVPVPVPGLHAAWNAQALLDIGQQWAKTGQALFAASLEGGNIEAAIYYGQKLADSQVLPMYERLLLVDKLVGLYERMGRKKQALDLLSSFEEHLSWRHYKTMAMLYIPGIENDLIIKAIEAGMQKIPAEDAETIARAGIWKGWVMALKGNAEAGEKIIRDEMVSLDKNTDAEPDKAHGFSFLGEIAKMQKKDGKTELDLYYNAIRFGKRTVNPCLLSKFYKRAGDLCRKQRKHDEAISLYNSSALVINDGLPFIGQFIAYNGISYCYYDIDQYPLALESMGKAWSAKITAEDSHRDVYWMSLLAGIYDCQGLYQQALSTFESVARMLKDLNQTENYIMTIINMSRVERCLGKYSKSKLHLLNGLELARQNNIEYLQIIALHNLGYLESDHQDYLKSNDYLRQSEVIRERSGSELDFDAIFYGILNSLFLDAPSERSYWELLMAKYPPSSDIDKLYLRLLQGLKLICTDKVPEGMSLATVASDGVKSCGQPLNCAKYRLFAGELALRKAQPEDLPAIIQCLSSAMQEFEQLGSLEFLARAKEQITKASILLAASPAVSLSHPMLDGLYQLCSTISAHGEPAAVAGKALSLVMELLGAERGGIFLKNPDGTLTLAAQVELDGQTRQDAYEYSLNSLKRAVEGEDLIYSNDTELDEAFRSSLSVRTNKIHSLLCAPIVFREGALGAVYLDSRLRTNLFDAAQRRFLKAMVDIMGAVLEGSHLLRRLEEDNQHLRARASGALSGIIGESAEMAALLGQVRTVAPVDISVLIAGETGTGKELIARSVHELSLRQNKVFVAIDCGALPENLLEAELFGYAKGAFTDAKADKAGLFEAAEGGTVFLDEVNSASKAVQARLLRVIEAGKLRRVGETKERQVNVRLICASNADLEREIEAGRFRQDLYYRIREVRLQVPPLRERKKDILILAEFFKLRFMDQFSRKRLRFSAEAERSLLGYRWPGNVRELEHIVKSAVLLAPGTAIQPKDLELPGESTRALPGGRVMKEEREKLEIVDALKAAKGNVKRTADFLGISRSQLYREMKKYKITATGKD